MSSWGALMMRNVVEINSSKEVAGAGLRMRTESRQDDLVLGAGWRLARVAIKLRLDSREMPLDIFLRGHLTKRAKLTGQKVNLRPSSSFNHVL